MSYDRPSPTTAQSKRRISRSMMVFASAAFISGGIALPATAAIAPQTQASVKSLPSDGSNPHRQPGGGAYGPDTCMPGYVWRDSFDGDTLCVTPAQRQQVHDQNPHRQPGGGAYGPSTCKPGYVWRDSFDGDTLCVTPAQRQQVHDQNPHRQPGGGAYGPSTCKPGYVWRDSFDGDTLCVTPAQRQQAKSHGTVIDHGPHLVPVDE